MLIGSNTSLGQYDLTVKVILLGDYSVGKSSLLRNLTRFSSDINFQGNTSTSSSSSCSSKRESLSGGQTRMNAIVRSTVHSGGFVDVEFTHQDKTVLTRIADTGGQERYRSMTSSYYRGAHGCLLMFDVTKEESFANLDTWIREMESYKPSRSFSCILVGTRRNSPARRVTYERAAAFAESRGFVYMELDMDYSKDVHGVFHALLDSVTINLNQQPSRAFTICPHNPNKDVMVLKKVVCSC